MEIIKIESTDSTSSHLAGIAEGCAHGTAVMARVQTAGRGQRGNSWGGAGNEYHPVPSSASGGS